jgi:hypothetical protein
MTTYYVNPAGGNINNNGSVNTPWDTLSNVFINKKKFNAGDIIILMSGYHGMPNISGNNLNYVTIMSGQNQTPCVGALTFDQASYWVINGLTISRSLIPPKHPDYGVKIAGIRIATQTIQTCSFITIKNCSVYARLDSSKWTAKEWENLKAPVFIYGTKCSLLNNHFFNGCGLQIGYHADNAIVSKNLIENFASDGVGNRSNSLTFTNNIVRNCHKVNGNHNDLFQSWGNSGTNISNNIFVAWLPGNKFLSGSADGKIAEVSDFQGVGGYDGSFKKQTIANNEVYVDHPIGIWILNATDCIINNNFVRRCGKYTYFSAKRKPYALPSVSIQPSKSGASSKNNTIINNRAEAFYLTQTGGTSTNNVVISGTAKKQNGTGPTTPFVKYSINSNSSLKSNTSLQSNLLNELNVISNTKTTKINSKPEINSNNVNLTDINSDSNDSNCSDLCYSDIYSEVILDSIDFSVNPSYIGVQINWLSVDNVEGYFVYYKNEQIAKLYNCELSLMIPSLSDLDISNYKIVPYKNIKKI